VAAANDASAFVTAAGWSSAGPASRLVEPGRITASVENSMSLSLLSLAQLGLGIAALTTVVMAAWSDLRTRLIANRLPAILFALAIPCHALGTTDWQQALASGGSALALAAIVFLLGYALWRLGGVGGGDVKLLVAATFLVGTGGFATLLVGTAFTGGLLALLYLVVPTRLPLVGYHLDAVTAATMTGTGEAVARPGIPYGIAIASGTAFAIVPTLPLIIG
jgi:prepilin peptidase CpaA